MKTNEYGEWYITEAHQNGGECCECLSWSPNICQEGCVYQRPKALMVESSIPACAAAVAAPILKLCPAYRNWSRPIWANTFRTAVTNQLFVKGLPSWNWKKGPGPIKWSLLSSLVIYSSTISGWSYADGICRWAEERGLSQLKPIRKPCWMPSRMFSANCWSGWWASSMCHWPRQGWMGDSTCAISGAIGYGEWLEHNAWRSFIYQYEPA